MQWLAEGTQINILYDSEHVQPFPAYLLTLMRPPSREHGSKQGCDELSSSNFDTHFTV